MRVVGWWWWFPLLVTGAVVVTVVVANLAGRESAVSGGLELLQCIVNLYDVDDNDRVGDDGGGNGDGGGCGVVVM